MSQQKNGGGVGGGTLLAAGVGGVALGAAAAYGISEAGGIGNVAGAIGGGVTDGANAVAGWAPGKPS